MNLFIDTHLNDIVVILHNNGNIIKEKKIQNEKENSKLIMPTIKELIDNEKINSIIVVNGPGSFTGVRLGVTIAKTLAYTLEIPIRTITSLECMAVCSENNKTVAFSDKNGYYIGSFDNDMNVIEDYKYLSKNEFEEYSKLYNIILDVKKDYEKIIDFALNKKCINPHEVKPIYIKKIDVEK